MTKFPAKNRWSAAGFLIAAIGLLMTAGTVTAQIRPGLPGPATPGGPPSAEQITKLEVRADRDTVSPGETLHLAIYFESRPTWHVYWRNPGEGAAAPEIEVTAPEGFTVGEPRWPRPILKNTAVGDTFILEGRVALIVPITAPKDLTISDQPLLFRADVTWAVCDDNMCLFGQGRRDVRVTAAETPATKTNPDITRRIELLPRRGELAGDARIEQRGDRLHLSVPAHGKDVATFFPLRSSGVEYAPAEIERRGDRIHVMVPMRIRPQNFLSGPPLVGGLVALGKELEDPGYELEVRLRTDASSGTP